MLSGGSWYFRPFFFGRPGALFLLFEGKCRLFLGKGRLFAFFVFWNAVFTREIPLSSPCKVRGDLWEIMNGDMVKLLCSIMKNKFDIFVRYFFMPIL